MNKKLLIAALVLLMGLMPKAWAFYDFSVTTNGVTLYYFITGDDSVEVACPGSTGENAYAGFPQPSGDVVIPSTVSDNDGYIWTVSSISNYAFYGCTGITSVTIPNTVTRIGNQAFYQCIGITSVTLSNTLQTIGQFAFNGCTGLPLLEVPVTVTSIGTSAFYGINMVIYPGNYTNGYPWGASLIYKAYENGFLFSDADKHQLARYIGSDTDIIIPASVTTINTQAFSSNSNITSVVIPEGVTSIGDGAFSYCTNLTQLYWNAKSVADFSVGMSQFSYSPTLTVIFGDSVQRIPNYAFNNCANLTDINIPNSVNGIGYHAFRNCTGLTTLTLPTSLTDLGSEAFAGCTGLTSLVYNADTCTTNTPFGTHNINITSLTIGSNIRYIDNNTFFYFSNLNEVRYTGTVEEWMGISINGTNPLVFSHNLYIADTLLTRLDIPEGVTAINNNFQGDTALTHVTIPSTVTSIAGYAFSGCAPTWFYFKPAVPPTLENSQAFIYTIDGGSYGSYMMVPWRSLQAYKTATNYTIFAQNHLYPDSCMLTVNINDPTLGSATLDGGNTLTHLYPLFDSATVAVTVNDPAHYHAEVMADGCTGISREGDTYKVRFNQNIAYPTVTVNFLPDTFHVAAVANSAAHGTVTGSNDYLYGDQVTVEATAADGYYFVQWADGSTDNPATFVCTGDTTVTAIFSNDVTPELCMVSVQNDRNVLLWNREDLPIESYTVYRESTTAGEYEAIATLPYAEAGTFTDSESHPASRSYRYRLTATDTYGNESEPGGIHKTMHLTINQGIGSTWNLVWTEYEGASYTTYVIYRGTDASNVQQIDIMPSGGNTTYTDENAPAGTVYYQVGVMMTTPCGDGAKSATISRSNIASNEGGTTPTYYTITVQSADNTMGTVTGGNSYAAGTSCTITATAEPGYHFVRWNDNITANPYTFTVTESATYTAYFEANSGTEVYYTVTVLSDNTDMGTVSGGGQVLEHGSTSISATAKNGYRFVRWNDNNTENPRTVTDVTADVTYTAYFEAVGGTEGIDDITSNEVVRIYSRGGRIIVEGTDDEVVVFDILGRRILNTTLPAGVYMVKVGDRPARKVVVTR